MKKEDALEKMWAELEANPVPEDISARKAKFASLMAAAPGALSGPARRVLRPVVWAPLAAAACIAAVLLIRTPAQPTLDDSPAQTAPGFLADGSPIEFVPKNGLNSEQITRSAGSHKAIVCKTAPICIQTHEKMPGCMQNHPVLQTEYSGTAESIANSEEPGSVSDVKPSTGAAPTETASSDSNPDPFAEMAAEDARAAARRSRRPALLAGITGLSVSGSKTASNTVPGIVGPSFARATLLSSVSDVYATSDFIPTLPYTENGHFSPPVIFSADIVYPLTNKLSLRSGLFYTWLHSSYTLKQNAKERYITENLHYIGIPLRADWSLAKAGSFDFYLSAGGSAAYLFSGADEHPWQFSADLAAGAVWMCAPRIGLYLEPQLNYYFDDGSDIYNYYCVQPFSFCARLGIRFNL